MSYKGYKERKVQIVPGVTMNVNINNDRSPRQHGQDYAIVMCEGCECYEKQHTGDFTGQSDLEIAWDAIHWIPEDWRRMADADEAKARQNRADAELFEQYAAEIKEAMESDEN